MKHRTLLSSAEQKASQSCFKSKDDYDEKLKEMQALMLDMQQVIRAGNRKVILVFEGADAAGKGGAIKRITEVLDPRGFKVHATGAPNAFESKENYMQRFFKSFPRDGEIAIFDRSWYGRVLVERVEGLIPKKDWKRAYDEINAIEAMLAADGVLILKYLLDISYGEQNQRFKDRAANPLTRWKITEDDRRNRRKWNQYFEAFTDMIENTSTRVVPWEIVAADSKWSARVSILKDVISRGRREFGKS
jgi:AMP-polyphosphate phosphotransferase